MSGWFDGTVGDTQVSALFDCASTSLTQFRDRLKGSQPGQTSAEELRSFLQTYFIKDFKISDGLLSQAMEVKRAWVGGDARSLTRAELAQLIHLMGVFKQQFAALTPYMPLVPDRAIELGTAELDAAVTQLIESAQTIGEALGERAAPYRFGNFTTLADELEAVPSRESGSPLLPWMREHLPLIALAKSLLISPGEQEFGGAAWRSDLKEVAEWYGLYLKARQFRKRYPRWESGDGFERLVSLGETAFEDWLHSASRQPDRQIAFRDIERLLKGLPPDTLPGDAHTTAQAIRALTRRMLRQGATADGVGMGSIQVLRAGFRDWVFEQRHLGRVFAKNMTGLATVPEILRAPRPRPESDREREVIEAFEAGLRDPRKRALYAESGEEMSFQWEPGAERQSFNNLSILNWMDKISGLIVSGYGQRIKADGGEEGMGITLPGYVQFFADIRELGIQLRLFDPNDFTTPFKRFREANLFTYGGNGDKSIDRTESTQLLADMYSARSLSSRVHDKMLLVCPNGEKDIYEVVTVSPECHRRQYFPRWHHFLHRMPRLLRFYDGMGAKERDEFQRHYEEAGRKVGFSEQPMGAADEDGYGMLPLYVETSMARYDRDGDQQIDPKEAELAFPVFRGSLETLYKAMNPGKALPGESVMFAIFTYLLEYGRQPTPFELGRWLFSIGTWDFRIDRFKVVRILAFLTAADRKRRAQIEEELRGLSVTDMMERELQSVMGDPELSLIKD